MTTTIDLAALAAELEREGWTVRETPDGHIAELGIHGITLFADYVAVWDVMKTERSTYSVPANLISDPIWQKALPILLRHVAGEGEWT